MDMNLLNTKFLNFSGISKRGWYNLLREDAHKKNVFLVVGPLRGGGE